MSRNQNESVIQRESHRCCVAFGSNLDSKFGSRLEILNHALSALQSLDFKLIKCSEFYESEAFPKDIGSSFVNCCAIFDTKLTAMDVLKHLHEVEAVFGRTRNERWGPRVIDLDLIYFNDLIYPEKHTVKKWMKLSKEKQKKYWPPEMVLPHPRLQDRAFVLTPMRDVDRHWVHPILEKSVDDMLSLIDQNLRNEVKKI